MCTNLVMGGSHCGGRVGEAPCKGQTTCDLHNDEMGWDVVVVVCVFGVVGRCNVFTVCLVVSVVKV